MLALAPMLALSLATASTASAAEPSAVQLAAAEHGANGVVQVVQAVSGGSAVTAATAGATPMAAGTWKAGCQVSGYDSSDNVYIYTLWQVFTTNGTTITSKSPPTYSSWSGQGWVLTNAPAPTGWWVTTNKKWAAQGNFTYTQYFFGFPVKSSSGWVEITVNYNGTWSCLNG